MTTKKNKTATTQTERAIRNPSSSELRELYEFANGLANGAANRELTGTHEELCDAIHDLHVRVGHLVYGDDLASTQAECRRVAIRLHQATAHLNPHDLEPCADVARWCNRFVDAYDRHQRQLEAVIDPRSVAREPRCNCSNCIPW